MVSKRSPKFYNLAQVEEDKALALVEISIEMEKFSRPLAEAFAEAAEGKMKKLKKVASDIELYRVVVRFVEALKMGDRKEEEYYGNIIRSQYTDKPKVSLEHSAGDGMQGVVILPKADKGE